MHARSAGCRSARWRQAQQPCQAFDRMVLPRCCFLLRCCAVLIPHIHSSTPLSNTAPPTLTACATALRGPAVLAHTCHQPPPDHPEALPGWPLATVCQPTAAVPPLTPQCCHLLAHVLCHLGLHLAKLGHDPHVLGPGPCQHRCRAHGVP